MSATTETDRIETFEERRDRLDWEEGLNDLFDAMERKLLDGSMSFDHAERFLNILGGVGAAEPSAKAEGK